jgi:selenide,water dikinase
LTKPLGLGIITTAAKNNEDKNNAIGSALSVMTTLNRAACEVINGAPAHALTDITGFGLLGHLRNMTAASKVTATVLFENVPVLAAAREYVQEGIAPGGTHANWRFLSDWVSFEAGLTKEEQLLLCDAQTSGGLLVALPAANAANLLQELRAAGVRDAAQIGQIDGAGAGRITVRRR